MTPQELWNAFEEAFSQSPSGRTFDDDAREMHQPGTYGQLKRSFDTVLNYWLDCDTIGGNTIMVSGYIKALDPEILNMVYRYQNRLEEARVEIANEVFDA